MFEQTFKNIDDQLWKDAGCSSELDYVEQTSWILFLKYLDDLEKEKKLAAELMGKTYQPIIAPEFQWEAWAVPKLPDGKKDFNRMLNGEPLIEFVEQKLFPYLKNFKNQAASLETIEYKIGEIFSEIRNKIQSGNNLRGVIDLVDELRFQSQTEKHEMSHLYEEKIKKMGNAGRNGGEYYTPRPLIKTIVKVVNPRIGEKIYDGAVGSAGFLVEAFEYLTNQGDLSTSDMETLQKLLNDEIRARAKKNLAQSKSLMELLENSINLYHNKIITAAEVIDELIKISKDIKEMDKEPEEMGLSDFEYAFYTAVANNESARELMQVDKLRELVVFFLKELERMLLSTGQSKKVPEQN